MGWCRLAAIECNYKDKEKDRQLNINNIIHGLNDNDLPSEIVRELTKTQECSDVTNEQMLVWAQRVKAQKARSVIITSLSKTKHFDKIKTVKAAERQYKNKTQTCAKTPTNQSCRYCGSSFLSRRCPVYGKKCVESRHISHLQRYTEMEEIEPSMTWNRNQTYVKEK